MLILDNMYRNNRANILSTPNTQFTAIYMDS